jgi:peptidoglycan LD-endopeptidase LytH
MTLHSSPLSATTARLLSASKANALANSLRVCDCGSPRRPPRRDGFAQPILTILFSLGLVSCLSAQPFQLPTANHALFEKGGEEKFFVGTVGKPWTSGCFGCVRTEGAQMHEGLDIRCLHRDQRGEPTDPILATADGTVAYINTRPSLSNFGNYIVLRHLIGGVEIYSSYAHLREIRPGLKIGQSVKGGETIATMGRTANTHEGISKDRAHVHFELNLFVNDRFPAWHKKTFPGQRNDHAAWNGQNLVGLDPRQVLLEQHQTGTRFDLLRFIQGQTELCRAAVRATDFPWLKRYPGLVRPNPKAVKEGIAGYEVALNFNAVAFELIPRAASEIKGQARFQLLSVNEIECRKNRCRRLVTQRGGRWELTSRGLNALELLTY